MLKVYNSLSRKVEEFVPIDPQRAMPAGRQVGMYVCGPTVYHFAHIGNFRTYTTSDILLRTLKYNSYRVRYIMNLTDVGHLTGDNAGDADLGEDRMEKTAKKEGKTAREVADFYTEAFLKDFAKLGLIVPDKLTKATDHIKEQINLISTLEDKGYTYRTSDGIYFDTTRFPEYGALSNLDEIKDGARIDANLEKKNTRDFALWKFSPTREKRQMEWESPWGVGFPGWHIECSAMAMKYLGTSFDIHAGGIDLKSTHHPNEIAQSEAATGKKFVNYWVHSAFMLVQGEKMSKSLGNIYRVYDLEKNGYDPVALRYLFMQTHYRQEMNFTFPALEAAQNALQKLQDIVSVLDGDKTTGTQQAMTFEERFLNALNEDLNTPQAIAVMWEMVKSDVSEAGKLKTLLKFDEVLGFGLKEKRATSGRIRIEDLPEDMRNIIAEREQYRKEHRYASADKLRMKIKKMGYEILDNEAGIEIRKV